MTTAFWSGVVCGAAGTLWALGLIGVWRKWRAFQAMLREFETLVARVVPGDE